jgi:hypothetical protein
MTTDYRELEERAKAAGHDDRLMDGQLYLDLADAIKALREENERLKFALDRWKLAESLDLECQCAPDKQVKTFTRNCGYVCGQCGKLIGLSDAALSPKGNTVPDTEMWVRATDYDALRVDYLNATQGRDIATSERDAASAECARLTAERAALYEKLVEEREMHRRAQHPEPFHIGAVYTQRGGIRYMLPIVHQWNEYPDIALEVGWCEALAASAQEKKPRV